MARLIFLHGKEKRKTTDNSLWEIFFDIAAIWLSLYSACSTGRKKTIPKKESPKEENKKTESDIAGSRIIDSRGDRL